MEEMKDMRDNCYESLFSVSPTHRCFICDKLEDPKAILSYNKFWLCSICRDKLKELLYPLGIEAEEEEK